MRRLLLLLLALASPALAQTPAYDLLLGGGNNGPSLDLNFATGVMDSRVNFTRASSATYFNSAGVLTTAATNAPRFDFNPTTLAPLGLETEEARTNSIRNNTMVGAVAGSPGTPPTNWAVNAGGGLSSSIIGSGTESGVPYVDINIAGTATGTVNLGISFDTNVAATVGQSWSQSAYFRLASGSLTPNAQPPQLVFQERNSSNSVLTQAVQVISPAITSAPLVTQRSVYSYTTTQATTAFISYDLFIQYTVGQVVNFTLRIGAPQLELGAFATSAILTSGSTATRAADSASMPVGPWYAPTAGTLMVNATMDNAGSSNSNQEIGALYSDNNDVISLRFASTGQANVGVFINNFNVGGFSGSSPSSGTPFLIGTTYNYSALSGLFGLSGTITAYTVTGYPSVTSLGIGGSGRGSPMNGWIKRVRYWPYAQTAAQLQAD